MTRTERRKAHRPDSENAICRTCMDSVVEELRAPHIANATGNGFTTEWQDEREKRKKNLLDNGYTTCYNMHSE